MIHYHSNIHNCNYNHFSINNNNNSSNNSNISIITDSNDDNKYNNNNNNRTMTVLLYGSNDKLTIYCSYGDICRIGCFSEDACLTVDIYCNGTCLVDCDVQ